MRSLRNEYYANLIFSCPRNASTNDTVGQCGTTNKRATELGVCQDAPQSVLWAIIRKLFIITHVLAFGGHILSISASFSIFLFFYWPFTHTCVIFLTLLFSLSYFLSLALCHSLSSGTHPCHHRHLYITLASTHLSLRRSKRCTIKCPYCELSATKQSLYFVNFPLNFHSYSNGTYAK